MPPGWLKKRGSLRDVENVSTRKLSVRLKSDKARESAADKVKRRASQSTGTSGIRHYGEVELEVEKEILGYFTERAPAKKALEPWRTNLRKPIKLDPLPAPELPRVSGYPAHARGDEWQRVVGSIDDEALTVPGHHAGLDEASELAKTKFLARAKRAVIASAKAAYVASTTPLGSVLYGFDPEGERLRLKSKKASELYVRRTAYYATIQKRRRSSLAGSASGEYAQLLLATRGNMDAALRDQAARDRERKLRALTRRVLLRNAGLAFGGWRTYAAKLKKAKLLFAKICASTERVAFQAFHQYVVNEKKVRRMLRGVFNHLETHALERWTALVDYHRRARHYLGELRRLCEDQRSKRDAIGNFLLSNSLQKRFDRWREYKDLMKRVKAMARRVFGDAKRLHFDAWAEVVHTGKRLKDLMKRLFDNTQRDHFEAWARFARMAALARKHVGYIFARGLKLVFFAWKRQAREDHTARIRKEGRLHPHDLISRFYNDSADVARHRQPSVVVAGPGKIRALVTPNRSKRSAALAAQSTITSNGAESGAPDWYFPGASPPRTEEGHRPRTDEAPVPPSDAPLWQSDDDGSVVTFERPPGRDADSPEVAETAPRITRL